MNTTVLRCPYCVEGGNFKIMTKKGEGCCYMCTNCNHTVVTDEPGYRCGCVKCTQASELGDASR